MNIIEKKDTEIIDKLYLELSQFTNAQNERDIQLNTLLMQVSHKFPDETRYQTALRYVSETEKRSDIIQRIVNTEIDQIIEIFNSYPTNTGNMSYDSLVSNILIDIKERILTRKDRYGCVDVVKC